MAAHDVPAVAVRRLTKTYPGGVEAVKALDFDVAPGEVFGLLGPNGAGKSTTIGMLTTTIAPTSGGAALAGYDVVRRPLQARAVSSVVFQEPVVDRGLSGRANLELHARLWGVDGAAIGELAGALGVEEILDRPVAGYSGGQRRRLEIARALVSRPRVLFLDEPTVGLDPRIRLELLDVIAGLRARDGMTIVLTTHYLEEAEELCDRIAIIHHGRVIANEPTRDLVAKAQEKAVVVTFDRDIGEVPANSCFDNIALVDERTLEITYRKDRVNAGQVLGALTAEGLGIVDVSTRDPDLEDVFLSLVSEQEAA